MKLIPYLRWSFLGGVAAVAAASSWAQSRAPEPQMVPLVAGAGNKATVKTVADTGKTVVTFNKDIAPIMFENCSGCHRAGEVAPFPLLTYADAKKRAKQIAMVTESHFMPPWKADEGKEKFVDAHVLSPEEIAKIRQWADNGAPEGNKADLPATPKFTQGWQAGEPDAVFQPSEEYHLDAEGDDVYRCFVIPTNYPEDRYISAMEVRPSNRAVVHHVIAYLDTSGKAREKDAADPGPGYTSFGGIGVTPAGSLGGWAPGLVPRFAPIGTGTLLPKGADIVLQVHYHKSGKPEADLTKIGLHFTKGPVDKRIRNVMVINPLLRIPPGEKNYEVSAEKSVSKDITVLSVVPHMHLLGKTMNVTATLPDGKTEKLVNVTDWDFNWQTIYGFKNPVKLPGGSVIHMTASYDNSTDNPTNPAKEPKMVTWGEQTTDEMCIAFLSYTVDSEHLTQGQDGGGIGNGLGLGGGGGGNSVIMQMAVRMFDKNGNGKLDPDEQQAALDWWKNRAAGDAGAAGGAGGGAPAPVPAAPAGQ